MILNASVDEFLSSNKFGLHSPFSAMSSEYKSITKGVLVFSWEFPSFFLSEISFRYLRVYFSGTNLFNGLKQIISLVIREGIKSK